VRQGNAGVMPMRSEDFSVAVGHDGLDRRSRHPGRAEGCTIVTDLLRDEPRTSAFSPRMKGHATPGTCTALAINQMSKRIDDVDAKVEDVVDEAKDAPHRK
jgi:hypothetical protein